MSASRSESGLPPLSLLRPLGLIKALRSGKPGSMSEYDWWGQVEEVCGKFVVLGLVVETSLVIALPDPLWIKLLTLLSDACIAAGVWGELWAGKRTRIIGDGIIEEAKARAEEANKIAEQTRLERLQLETKLAPRSLSDDDAKRIRDALSPFADVRADLVSYGSGFPEVARTCGVLMHVLHVSGWRMNALPPPEPIWTLEGIHVGLQQPHDEKTLLAKSALINVLNEVGWDSQEWLLPLPTTSVPGMIVDSRFSAPMRIMVGFKPDPLNPATSNTDKNNGT